MGDFPALNTFLVALRCSSWLLQVGFFGAFGLVAMLMLIPGSGLMLCGPLLLNRSWSRWLGVGLFLSSLGVWGGSYWVAREFSERTPILHMEQFCLAEREG